MGSECQGVCARSPWFPALGKPPESEARNEEQTGTGSVPGKVPTCNLEDLSLRAAKGWLVLLGRG